MSFNVTSSVVGQCPCRLSQEKVMYLDDKGHVPLGSGGICRNPKRDGTATECGMVLADHHTEGVSINKMYPSLYFNKLFFRSAFSFSNSSVPRVSTEVHCRCH